MRAPRTLFPIFLFLATLQATMRPAAVVAQESAPPNAPKHVGVIKAIDGSSIALTQDAGPEVNVTVPPTARIIRIAPGEKSLKNAVPIQLQDLQIGDRILVGSKPSDDAKTIEASSVVVMKKTDVASLQDQQRQDWQKRGMGGLVREVNAQTGTVSVTVTGFTGTRTIAVHTSPATVIRRYAPDSVKFDDAKTSTLAEIHPGDQLRARGDRNADGAEFTAVEIVAGSFKNIAGLINSVDAVSGTLNVQDVLSKKPVQVKITADSQLRKIPAEMAQHIAARLKGAATAAPSGEASSTASGSSATPAGGARTSGQRQGGGAGSGMRSGGAPDFQQMLSHMPTVTLADLHKGDAVMMVTTQGTDTTGGTAITLLGGVEPILQAAPNGSQAMMLAPWTLGGPSGDAASQ